MSSTAFIAKGSIQYTTIVDSTEMFTTVLVEIDCRDEKMSGIGFAKRHPGDKHDQTIASSVAMSRAFRDLADKIEGL